METEKKYRLIKNTVHGRIGAEITQFGGPITIALEPEELVKLGYAEEVIKNPKPKYKVGDKIVLDWTTFSTISGVQIFEDGERRYFIAASNYSVEESCIQLATQEEIDLYFN